MGKGWARGLSATSDPRIARAAAAHRGKRYVRRTPPGECKWRVAGLTKLPLAWSPEMAYIVGLTATDGCLHSGRRKMTFKSCDAQLVRTYLDLLGRTNRVKQAANRIGGVVYFTEFHDSALYEWFQAIGLTPRKSLTLGAIEVPDEFLLPLVRGLLDGDGNITNKIYRADTGRRADYFWEYLMTRFTSASQPHLVWLRESLRRVADVDGYLHRSSTTTRGNAFFLAPRVSSANVVCGRRTPHGMARASARMWVLGPGGVMAASQV